MKAYLIKSSRNLLIKKPSVGKKNRVSVSDGDIYAYARVKGLSVVDYVYVTYLRTLRIVSGWGVGVGSVMQGWHC